MLISSITHIGAGGLQVESINPKLNPFPSSNSIRAPTLLSSPPHRFSKQQSGKKVAIPLSLSLSLTHTNNHASSSQLTVRILFVLIKMATGIGLDSLVNTMISVITNDGRNIVGVLKGYDQATNIILDESHERVYSTKEGVQLLALGLYIIRGDNISVVGEIDEDLEAKLDFSRIRAHPLKPVMH
ncbi:hypothetical protein LUZ60_001099 [Juncus effusus]|nr:hypothetical protein LUZ60_001099 [Juncus effusus]